MKKADLIKYFGLKPDTYVETLDCCQIEDSEEFTLLEVQTIALVQYWLEHKMVANYQEAGEQLEKDGYLDAMRFVLAATRAAEVSGEPPQPTADDQLLVNTAIDGVEDEDLRRSLDVVTDQLKVRSDATDEMLRRYTDQRYFETYSQGMQKGDIGQEIKEIFLKERVERSE